MKEIEVVGAIIRDGDKILATQKGYGDFIEQWEFPGGKVEPGESLEDALHREIKEELNTEIIIDDHFMTVTHQYPKFHATVHCYLCHLTNGFFELLEHTEARWVDKENIDSLNWLPADIDIIERLKKVL